MATIQTNEFRTGMKVIIENNLCEIIEHQFHKPGKGQAVMRVKYKNLISSQVLTMMRCWMVQCFSASIFIIDS